MYVQLLAKFPKDKDKPSIRETLAGHLIDIVHASATIISCYGDDILDGMGLKSSRFRSILNDSLLRASLLHDLGKANSHFQQAVREKGFVPQAFRHEWLSAWIPLASPDFYQWIFKGLDDLAVNAILFAVMGHHLKFPDASVLNPREGAGLEPIDVFLADQSILSCINEVGNDLGLKELPKLKALQVDLFERPLAELKSWLVSTSEWFHGCSKEERHFVAAIKALLIAADVAGSALARGVSDSAVWIKRALERVCRSEFFENIASRSLQGKEPRDFQVKVAESCSDKIFIRAGCGSGKTLAAFLWAQRWAKGKKLFFCYPTTGTASEGFRDYFLPEEMGIDAELVHSRAAFDIEYFMSSPGEDTPCISGDEFADDMVKIDALVSWDVPITVCTSDQVLGLVQNNRKPLFSFPCLGNAAFVFDEIHQYDHIMFRSFLAFLRAFPNAPVLMMTASLQNDRLEALRETLSELGESLEIIDGPPEFESVKRYRIWGIADDPPWEEVIEALERDEKVLWVSNTVNRCVLFGKEAKERGLNPIVYHSRFRYGDRLRKHRQAIDAFEGEGAALVMATQVCEVSLDISSQLLVTDLAPPSSLVQRMGRLNRRLENLIPDAEKPVIFLQPESPRPYTGHDLELARQWIDSLGGGAISQVDLDEALRLISEEEKPRSIESKWLDGGPFSELAPVRDPGYTAPFVLEEDLESCLDENRRPIRKEVIRHSIPMPLYVGMMSLGQWRRWGYFFVAPAGSISYSDEWGGKWAIR